MPFLNRLSSALQSGQRIRKTPPANYPPKWVGAGSTSSGSGFNSLKFIYTSYQSSTVPLSAGSYTVYVWGGAGGWADGGGNGKANGGGGGCIVHSFTLASTTLVTMQAGQCGGKVNGNAQSGRLGKGGIGYRNGGDGGGDSPALTDDAVYEYTSAGVYTFTSPGLTGGTCTFEITLIGGGGGAGGDDSTNLGGNGGGGRVLTGIWSGAANTTYTVLVGGGGGGGSSTIGNSGRGSGTTNSGVFTGLYNGANGGNAGSVSQSGAGGGGGSATVFRSPTAGDVLIAAGGGGGGGAGGGGIAPPDRWPGRSGSLFYVSTGLTTTNGSPGDNPNVDAGGGGGGGGGYSGGKGGVSDGTDYGGNSGNPGLSYIGSGTFVESFMLNGGRRPGGAGSAGYFRCRVYADVSQTTNNWKGGGGGASSVFSTSSFTLEAAGGGGAGGDGQNPAYPATGGGKTGNDSTGGPAGSDGLYSGGTPAGSSGTAQGGGGGGADESFNDPVGGGGKGGLNTGTAGATFYVGQDGVRNGGGAAGNSTDPNYELVSFYVPYCADGRNATPGGNGAILIIKNS